MNDRRGPLRYALFGLVAILLPGMFIFLQIRRGSDGAHLIDSAGAFSSRGLAVSPYVGVDSRIQPGTVVTRVDGREMDAWAQALIRPGVRRPSWRPGDRHTYSLLLPDGRELRTQITLERLPLGSILAEHWGVLAFAAISQLIAVFILTRRPGDPSAQVLFIWALSGSHAYAWSFPIQVGDLVGGVGFWLSQISTALMWVLYFAAGLHLAMVFPKPVAWLHRGSGRAIAIYLGAVGLFLATISWGGLNSGSILGWFKWWPLGADLVSAVSLAVTLVAIIFRYRRHLSAEERAKVRWAVYGASISGGLGLFLWILAPRVFGAQIMSANTLGLLMVIFPVSLAIAIRRHRLFDIDLIIRRTLVYAVLSALLVVVYLLSVVALQTLLRGSLADTSPLTVVLSTLAAAALFSPMHSRVQRVIDRQFYRRKYDASQALSRFAESSQEQVDLTQLVHELRQVVVDTMQPRQVMVWLKEETGPDGNQPIP
jgi:hypothetical protein